MPKQGVRKNLLLLLLIVGVFVIAFGLAKFASESAAIQAIVSQFGYLGVLIVGFIAGLNTFVPIHAAAFSPIFLSAGLSLPFVILALATGTMLADSVGFLIGKVSRDVIQETYPKIYNFFVKLHTERENLVLPFVFLYAAFVPFPNEAILIPLALAGVRFPKLILPLLIGNIINQTLWVYGVTNLFELLV